MNWNYAAGIRHRLTQTRRFQGVDVGGDFIVVAGAALVVIIVEIDLVVVLILSGFATQSIIRM